MIVVGRTHVFGPIGIVRVNEDYIGKPSLPGVAPELLDRIGNVVVLAAGEQASDRGLVIVVGGAELLGIIADFAEDPSPIIAALPPSVRTPRLVIFRVNTLLPSSNAKA